MGNCGSCGGGTGSVSRSGRMMESGKPARTDPSAALFASAGARYMVVRRAGDVQGKRFATLMAAQDYARRTGGVIRQV